LQAIILNKKAHKPKKGDELPTLIKNIEFVGQIISCVRKIAFSTLKRLPTIYPYQEQQSTNSGENKDTKVRSMLLNCAGTISKKLDKIGILQARTALSKSLESSVFFYLKSRP